MEDAGPAILKNSTLGIVLKVPRATTGPDARIMDEYGMNVQAGTRGIVRVPSNNKRRLPSG
jgi:hypothetical protein